MDCFWYIFSMIFTFGSNCGLELSLQKLAEIKQAVSLFKYLISQQDMIFGGQTWELFIERVLIFVEILGEIWKIKWDVS